MTKVLVTGGSGFIGINIVESLVLDGYTVLNIDRAAPPRDDQKKYWKDVDILNFELLKELIVDFSPEVIIHLAAVADLNGTDLEYYASNIQGTQNIIDIAANLSSLKRVFYTSSMYVCRPGFIPADNNTYNPHTVYGESKMKMELLIKNIKASNYDWLILRPSSIWGPWFRLPYIDFFDIVYKGKYFDFGSACTKTYGYIGNTVYQVRQLMEAADIHQKVFYLGDLPPTQISEWANDISIEMKKGPIRKVPYFVLKSAALAGDFLGLLKIKFPLTSFRLSNMTTNNILPLTNTYKVCGEPPFSRLEGVKKTLKWMQDFKGYKF
jgi:nucleoside-diphosphate-sugar epimerase